MNNCYCGSKTLFEHCCKPIIEGDKPAETAEQLMRSRYSAYATKQCHYIMNTYAPSVRLTIDKNEIEEWAEQTKWLKLTVLSTKNTDNNLAEVEFVAQFWHQGELCQLHENSNFIKFDGKWFYVDGTIFDA